MSIKPIDMQTSMGQMHEVARKEHAHAEALLQELHHLDDEADEKSNLAKRKLDESRESGEMTNRLDDREAGKGKNRKGRDGNKEFHNDESKRHIEIVTDENLGRFVDYKK